MGAAISSRRWSTLVLSRSLLQPSRSRSCDVVFRGVRALASRGGDARSLPRVRARGRPSPGAIPSSLGTLLSRSSFCRGFGRLGRARASHDAPLRVSVLPVSRATARLRELPVHARAPRRAPPRRARPPRVQRRDGVRAGRGEGTSPRARAPSLVARRRRRRAPRRRRRPRPSRRSRPRRRPPRRPRRRAHATMDERDRRRRVRDAESNLPRSASLTSKPTPTPPRLPSCTSSSTSARFGTRTRTTPPRTSAKPSASRTSFEAPKRTPRRDEATSHSTSPPNTAPPRKTCTARNPPRGSKRRARGGIRRKGALGLGARDGAQVARGSSPSPRGATALAALLPAVGAGAYLDALEARDFDPFHPELVRGNPPLVTQARIAWAACRGRY